MGLLFNTDYQYLELKCQVEVTAFSYSYFIKIHNSLLANQSGKFNLKNRIEHVLKWYFKITLLNLLE